MPAKTSILVFTRAPLPGHVKTRLIPTLGEIGATSLHIRMIEGSLSTATSLASVDVQLWCTPDDSHEFFMRCRNRFPITTHTQQGNNLGTRMLHAISLALKDADQVIIIGTDCPGISTDYLSCAIHALDQGYDAVLGPAMDGGYVLLGLRRSESLLFENIAWGTDSVLESTRNHLRNLDWRWLELEILRDIDRAEDLEYYAATLHPDDAKQFH